MWGPGDEGIFTEHGFLVYRIAILAAGGVPVVAPEKDLRADVDAILAKVTEQDQDRLPRQSQQPDRHLPALRRGEAPARGPAAACAAGARRGLCGICPPQRLRVGARARRHVRERGDDPHLLEDLRPRQPAPRLDGGAAPTSSTRSTASAARSTSTARPWRPASPRSRTRRMSRRPSRTTSNGSPGSPARSRPWASKVTPSVGNFLLIHFPKDAGRTAKDADAFLSGRGLILRRIDAYGLPDALRLTVGDEEANRPRRRGSARFPEAATSMPERLGPPRDTPLFERLALDRPRADRLVDRPRGAASQPRAHDRRHRPRRGGGRAGARARDRRRGDDRRGGRRARARISSSCACRSASAARWREAMRAGLKPGCIVSDVGSVKGSVVAQVQPHLPEGVHFVPAHPVAGTEHSGPDAGFATLFLNRWCILTPPEGTDEAAVERVRAFWAAMGSNVEVMTRAAPRPRARHHQPRAAPDRLQHRRHGGGSRDRHAVAR